MKTNTSQNDKSRPLQIADVITKLYNNLSAHENLAVQKLFQSTYYLQSTAAFVKEIRDTKEALLRKGVNDGMYSDTLSFQELQFSVFSDYKYRLNKVQMTFQDTSEHEDAVIEDIATGLIADLQQSSIYYRSNQSSSRIGMDDPGYSHIHRYFKNSALKQDVMFGVYTALNKLENTNAENYLKDDQSLATAEESTIEQVQVIKNLLLEDGTKGKLVEELVLDQYKKEFEARYQPIKEQQKLLTGWYEYDNTYKSCQQDITAISEGIVLNIFKCLEENNEMLRDVDSWEREGSVSTIVLQALGK